MDSPTTEVITMSRARGCCQVVLLLSVIAASPAAAARADVSLAVLATGVGATVEMTPTGNPTGCNAGDYCFYHYAAGTTVTLRAIPPAGAASFSRWLGACSGSALVCSVTLDANKTVAARFSPVRLYADEQSGMGSVSVSPPGRPCGVQCWEYPYAGVVALNAQAAAGWAFSSWRGLCSSLSGGSTCGLTMFSNVETAPTFRCTGTVCSVTQPLTREVKTNVHVRGSGSVTVNGKSCRGACSFAYDRGRAVVLRAVGSRFRGWSGWCTGVAPQCQFPAFKGARNQSPDVTAVFG